MSNPPDRRADAKHNVAATAAIFQARASPATFFPTLVFSVASNRMQMLVYLFTLRSEACACLSPGRPGLSAAD
jgi:hypothetical protein